MKPNKPGIYEWYSLNGEKKLIEVFNVLDGIPNTKPLLRVYWNGSYYNVHDENHPLYDADGNIIKNNSIQENAEWPDRWGKCVKEF